jgi:hypothetical protein
LDHAKQRRLKDAGVIDERIYGRFNGACGLHECALMRDVVDIALHRRCLRAQFTRNDV